MKQDQWLDWAIELQSLAQAGLTYGRDVYDLERYQRLRDIAAEALASQTDLPLEQVSWWLCNEVEGAALTGETEPEAMAQPAQDSQFSPLQPRSAGSAIFFVVLLRHLQHVLTPDRGSGRLAGHDTLDVGGGDGVIIDLVAVNDGVV